MKIKVDLAFTANQISQLLGFVVITGEVIRTQGTAVVKDMSAQEALERTRQLRAGTSIELVLLNSNLLTITFLGSSRERERTFGIDFDVQAPRQQVWLNAGHFASIIILVTENESALLKVDAEESRAAYEVASAFYRKVAETKKH